MLAEAVNEMNRSERKKSARRRNIRVCNLFERNSLPRVHTFHLENGVGVQCTMCVVASNIRADMSHIWILIWMVSFGRHILHNVCTAHIVTWNVRLGNSAWCLLSQDTLVDRWRVAAYTSPNHLMLMNISLFLHSSAISFFLAQTMYVCCLATSCARQRRCACALECVRPTHSMCIFHRRRVVLVLLIFSICFHFSLLLCFFVFLCTQFRQKALQMTTIKICLCFIQPPTSMHLWTFTFFFASSWPILNYGTIHRSHLLKWTFDMERIVCCMDFFL